ncbi:MAG: endonuclease [Candidatus Marinimicrobia bacterium]|nr:endonuclease [Candidatus Neomarinimicrobiota bacterium]
MFVRYILVVLTTSLILGRDNIGDGLYEDELINYLRSNYKTSSTLSYNSARDVMYGDYDNHNGVVYGVYTNFSVNNVPENDPRPTVHDGGLNCEHVWPQSMYEGSSPMKSDLHHLRPSKDNVNTSRGNKPFGENPDSQTDTWYWLNQSQTSTPSNNVDEYSESETAFFEPREDRKGDIARSMFYFYTMYSEVADGNFFDIQKDVLKTWHEQDPADENETTRTWAIAGYQQNKPNPFVLDETLIWRAYFYEGFMTGDLNEDGLLNILDLVVLVNIVLGDEDVIPAADINGDGAYNVLDVVVLANIILSQN